mgnify:CR=1 FL=1
MANIFAAYVSSDNNWSFVSNSYNSKVGFYQNAWLSSKTKESLPCAFFYTRGEKDETGFTPEQLSYDESQQVLTIIGEQKGINRKIMRAYKVGETSPRYLNLRQSETNVRPASFVVTNIITDTIEGMPNIKEYLGIVDEELTEEVSEEFGAENSRHYRKNDVLYERNVEGMICDCGNTSGWKVSVFDGSNPPEGCFSRVYDISCPSCYAHIVTYQSNQSSKSPFKIVYGDYGTQITPAFGAEELKAQNQSRLN